MTNISLEQKKNLEAAYDTLKKKIASSNTYIKFLIDNLDELQTIVIDMNTNKGERLVPNIIVDDLKNVDIVNTCCNYLQLDKEFNKAIIKGVLSDNLISNIINKKFIETLYGNPNKVDLDVNDALFIILESVFSLDTLTKSISNEDVLLDKFYNIMYPCEKEESYNFVNLINKIYSEAKDEKDYEKVLEIIRNYRQDLIPYVSAGINSTINDITDNNRSFKESDILLKQLMEVIGKTDARKM